MDTADPGDKETGGGLSTEKQNITSAVLFYSRCSFFNHYTCSARTNQKKTALVVPSKERSPQSEYSHLFHVKAPKEVSKRFQGKDW